MGVIPRSLGPLLQCISLLPSGLRGISRRLANSALSIGRNDTIFKKFPEKTQGNLGDFITPPYMRWLFCDYCIGQDDR
jgi:hypothetical protein